MRILCDQMVKKSFVSALEAEDRHTVARVRNLLAPDADDDAIAAHAVQHDWVILITDDDHLSDDVSDGLLFYDDDPAPTPGAVATPSGRSTVCTAIPPQSSSGCLTAGFEVDAGGDDFSPGTGGKRLARPRRVAPRRRASR